MPEEKRDLSSQSDSLTESDNFSLSKEGEQLIKAREQALLRAIKREETMKAFHDWIEFITLKTVGISSLIVGGLEIIAPTLFSITLNPPFTPFTLVGVGLALLTGKKSIILVKIILDTLAKEDKENNP